MESEGGFAEAGVGGEEGEFSEGDAGVPEPLEGFGGKMGERGGKHLRLLLCDLPLPNTYLTNPTVGWFPKKLYLLKLLPPSE
jgi:hypothetical protein